MIDKTEQKVDRIRSELALLTFDLRQTHHVSRPVSYPIYRLSFALRFSNRYSNNEDALLPSFP